jgi:hypothetical protein
VPDSLVPVQAPVSCCGVKADLQTLPPGADNNTPETKRPLTTRALYHTLPTGTHSLKGMRVVPDTNPVWLGAVSTILLSVAGVGVL